VETLHPSIMKGLAWFHRWVGIFLCLMFATWFATGAVMVFVAFPALPEAVRAARSEPIDLARVRLDPAEAEAALAGASDLRLVSIAGQPVYVATGPGKRALAISAETGRPLGLVSPAAAKVIAVRFGQIDASEVAGPFDYDQWVVHQQFDPLRPVYRVRLADQRHTDLYVSARTGQVIQQTRGYERAWNWLGSVVHWIYFVPIRKTFALWDWTVWVIALVGLSTTVAGVWLGLTRTSKKMSSKRPGLSPFRGLLRWHHIFGLAAGAFVLCWITSGWLSMDHGRLFSEGQATDAAAQAYRTGGGTSVPRGFSAADLQRLAPASSIEFQEIDGRDVARANGLGAPRVLIGDPAGPRLGDRIPRAAIIAAARAAWPYQAVEAVAPVAVDSAYAKAEGLPPEALLLKLGGPHPTRLYVDGVSGKILVVMDRSREAYAWVYYMLHTYNYPGLSSRPALRIAILLVPLTLGFAFSITGVLVGIRRLRALSPAPSPSARARRTSR
jgi:uncharacterized iron-regulated membrane protein